MPAISGPSITSMGCAAVEPRLLGVLHDPVGDALHQRVLEPFLHRRIAPGQVAGRLSAADLLSHVTRSAISSIRSVASGAAVEHHVLGAFAQVRVDVVVDGQRTGVDDAHVHARGDRVVQEDGVDRLADRVVAAEAEARRCRRRRSPACRAAPS